MTDVELHITLAITVDREVWRDAYFITEKGLAGDVEEHVRQTVVDSLPAHFEHAITAVETLEAVEVTS
jgi:hypothetical protein